MSYQVIIPKPVQKQLDALPEELKGRVLEKILSLVEDPRPSGVKKLKGLPRRGYSGVGAQGLAPLQIIDVLPKFFELILPKKSLF